MPTNDWSSFAKKEMKSCCRPLAALARTSPVGLGRRAQGGGSPRCRPSGSERGHRDVRGASGGVRWGWKTNGRRRAEGGSTTTVDQKRRWTSWLGQPGAPGRSAKAWGATALGGDEDERVRQRVPSGVGSRGRLGLGGRWVGELGVRVRDFLLGFWNLGRRNVGLLGSLCCRAASSVLRLTEKRTRVFGSPELGTEQEPILSVPVL
jgi:hypothetical protein